MHIIVLRLRGQLSEGIQVALEWGIEGSFQTQGTLLGTLTPNTDLTTLYADWHGHYCNLGEATRLEFEAASAQSLNLRRKKQQVKQQCDAAAQQLESRFRQWLNTSGDFQCINRQLSEVYGASEDIRLLIRTDNPELQRLPWHLWDQLQRHDRQIPISLGALEYQQGQASPLTSPVRVLAILGCDRNLNLTPDLEILNAIPNIALTCLEQPSRHQVAQALMHEPDILFFAGHSRTEDQQGILSINETDSFTSKELHHHLRTAATRGLKICIFNSCDGLGLARHLSDLRIPYVICMREPVPDPVAHRFFQSFIQQFSMSGCSIHHAVLAAQHDLEALQDRFPYATWLPALYQQPQATALTWPQPPTVFERSFRFPLLRAKYAWMLAAITAGVLLLAFPWRNPSTRLVQGDYISTGEEILGARPVHKVKAVRLLAQAKYADGIQKLLESWQDDGADPETLIYLNNAILDAYQIKHHTIAVSVPFLHRHDGDQISSHALAYQLLQGIAQAQTEANLNLGQLPKPPEVSLLKPNPVGDQIGLKVVIADDWNVTEQAQQRARDLVSNPKIMGVVGHYASDMSEPTIPIYREHQVPVISPGSSAKDLTQMGRGYFFRTVPVTTVAAASVANHLIQTNQKKVMVYYNPQSPFTHSFWDDFKDIYQQAGGQIVRQVQQNDAFSDLASPGFDPEGAIATLAQYGDPHDVAILLVPDGEVSSAQANALRLIAADAGRHNIVGSWGIHNAKTLEVLPNNAQPSLVVSVPWHAATSPNPNFSKNAAQLWGRLTQGQTALAYDATRAMIAALRTQTQPSPQGTRDVLADSSFSIWGATGKLAFEKSGDRKSPPQGLIRAAQCSSTNFKPTFIPIHHSC